METFHGESFTLLQHMQFQQSLKKLCEVEKCRALGKFFLGMIREAGVRRRNPRAPAGLGGCCDGRGRVQFQQSLKKLCEIEKCRALGTILA